MRRHRLAFVGLALVLGGGFAEAAVRVSEVRRLQDVPDPVLQAGDVVRYARLADGTRREVADLPQWRLLEIEATARGVLTLEGSRADAPTTWRLPAGQIETVATTIASANGVSDPIAALAETLEAALRARDWARFDAAAAQAEALPAAPDVAAWLQLLRTRAEIARGDPAGAPPLADRGLAREIGPMLRVQLLEAKAGALLMQRKPPEEYRPQLDEALAIAKAHAPDSWLHARIEYRLMQGEMAANAPLLALQHADAALAILSRLPDSLVLAELRFYQSSALAMVERNEEALAAIREAVAIGRAIAPDSAQTARWMAQLSNVERSAGSFDAAEDAARAAVQLLDRIGGTPTHRSEAYTALGNAQTVRGDIEGAQRSYEIALELIESTATPTVGMERQNLGVTALARGDLEAAHFHLARAVDIKRERAPASLSLARSLHSLARVLALMDDMPGAEKLLTEAAAIERAVNPDGQTYAETQTTLGTLWAKRGDFERAQAAFDDASRWFDRLPPDSHHRLPLLRERASLLIARQRPAQARELLAQGFPIAAKHAGDGLVEASLRQEEGAAALALRDAAGAEAALQRALSIQQDKAPAGLDLARTWFLLGDAAQLRGDATTAGTRYCSAADLLDRVRVPLGDDSYAQARFRAQFVQVYQRCLDSHMRAGRTEAAFRTLERLRGRAFVTALQVRDLVPGATEATREWTALQRRESGDSGHAARRIALERQLEAERPLALASLLPQALDAAQLRAAVPADAVAVSFSVGEEHGWTFRVTRDAIDAFPVEVGSAALERDVARMRALIARRDQADIAEIRSIGSRLYATLLEPALRGRQVRHLLIAPDGPLHDLPFAALHDDDRGRWLVDAVAFALIDSLTIEARLAQRDAGGNGRFLGVADATPEGGPLPPLPAAREEVRSAARHFGADAQVLEGEAATEAQARSLAPAAGDIHFAVHATLDPRRSLESALELRPGAASGDMADDGHLRLWEILAQWRLDARLVVVSGCDTAVGERLQGEGLFGFARAFRFAGAQRVVATLWPIQDRATAKLMDEFYSARAQGQDEDLALQRAARATLASNAAGEATVQRGVGALRPSNAGTAPMTSAHPYYWAAFQLYGAPAD